MLTVGTSSAAFQVTVSPLPFAQFFAKRGKIETCLLNFKLKAGEQGRDTEKITVSFKRESENGEKESSPFHFFYK